MTDDMIGRNLGPYEIQSVLGRGPNSVVYRAYQADANRTVAVKVLAPELGQEPDFEARFERDVRRLAELDHPHILPLYDAGVVGGYPFIIMEYMTGGTLANLLARYGKLSLNEAVPLIQQVAAALDYAHSKGIIHRYLKPQNILLDDQGEAYVTDFGIGQVREAVASAHQSGVLSGASYVSPEVISGVKRITSAADVYSLGVMLFEMLTGYLPFKGTTAAATARMHLTEEPPSGQALNPELSPEIDVVLTKALAKQPKDRYATASILAQALAQAAGIHTSSARQRPLTDTGTGTIRRPPMPAAPPKAPPPVSQGTLKRIQMEPETPPPGSLPTASQLRDVEMETPPPGFVTPPLGALDDGDYFNPMTPPPAASPNSPLSTGLTPLPVNATGTGSPISMADLPPKERKKLQKERERQRKELRKKLGVQGPRWYTAALAIVLVTAAWFMIGVLAGNQVRRQDQLRALAILQGDATSTANAVAAAFTATDDGSVIVVPTDETATETPVIPPTDTPSPTPTETATPTPTVTPSPTPTQIGGTQGLIAFVSLRDGDPEIYTLNLATGQTNQLTRNDDVVGWPAWSPDGQFLAFFSDMAETTGQHIYMMRADGSELEQLTQGNRIDNYPLWSPDGNRIAMHTFDGVRSFINTVTPLGIESQITQLPAAENRLLDWSPDGFILTYFGTAAGGSLEILRLDIDTGVRTPISSSNGGVEYLNYSPDRTQVVFTRYFTSGRQIFLADVDPDCDIVTECNPRRITNDRLDWRRPRFSPDGTILLASANLDDNLDLFIMTLDGTVLQQLTDSPADDFDATWQPMARSDE